uniref:Uncharacterized protein n=1 Tax=Lepeophtheirus salmonis TaxID=72036 RepID=A0A0K2VJW7_LEPSM
MVERSNGGFSKSWKSFNHRKDYRLEINLGKFHFLLGKLGYLNFSTRL